MGEHVRVLPNSKGFESKYGNYAVTITENMLEKLRNGQVLHIDVEEYSINLSVADKPSWDVTYDFDDYYPLEHAVQTLLEYHSEYIYKIPADIKEGLVSLMYYLDMGYFGLLQENMDLLSKIKKHAKNYPNVVQAISSI